MGPHDLAGDIEAQPQVFGVGVRVHFGPLKRLEDHGEHVRRNTDPLVRDLDDHRFAVTTRMNEDGRSRPGVAHCVAGDVRDDLSQAVDVPGPTQVALDGVLDLGGRTDAELVGDVSADISQVARSERQIEAPAQPDARELHELGDHSPHALTAGHDAVHQPRVGLGQGTMRDQQLTRHHDRRERVAEVVADDADEALPELRGGTELLLTRPQGARLGLRAALCPAGVLDLLLGLNRRQDQLLVRFALQLKQAPATSFEDDGFWSHCILR